jgi:hypothetical protein
MLLLAHLASTAATTNITLVLNFTSQFLSVVSEDPIFSTTSFALINLFELTFCELVIVQSPRGRSAITFQLLSQSLYDSFAIALR